MNYVDAARIEGEPHLKSTRVRFERILVAVDRTVSSSNTLKVAAELAQRSGGRLIVAHVLDPSLMLPVGTANDLRETLRLWQRPYVTEGTRCNTEVVEGDLVKEIETIARQYEADLLVIGTHSVPGMKTSCFWFQSGSALPSDQHSCIDGRAACLCTQASICVNTSAH